MAGAVTAHLEIPAEPAAAATVRAWLRRLLSEWLPDAIETAQLLTSELVTNAILHTADPIEITAKRSGAILVVEVIDRNPTNPVVKQYGAQAVTGRGLRLVDALADRWGVRGDDDRKAVWFEITDGPRPEPVALDAADEERWLELGAWTGVDAESLASGNDGPGERQVTVCLNDLPIDIYLEAEEHHDGLMREFALMRRAAGDERISRSPRLVEIAAALTGEFGAANLARRRQVEAARRAGATAVDLAVPFDANAQTVVRATADLLDELDELCAQDHMLTRPSSARLRRFRRWYADEVLRQLDGQAPSPWPYASAGRDADRSDVSSR
jgi:anti-sigma regulatory factor (Ser/Thr protein kinase)